MTNIVQVKPVGISWFNHKHMAVDASPVVNQEDNRVFFCPSDEGINSANSIFFYIRMCLKMMSTPHDNSNKDI